MTRRGIVLRDMAWHRVHRMASRGGLERAQRRHYGPRRPRWALASKDGVGCIPVRKLVFCGSRLRAQAWPHGNLPDRATATKTRVKKLSACNVVRCDLTRKDPPCAHVSVRSHASDWQISKIKNQNIISKTKVHKREVLEIGMKNYCAGIEMCYVEFESVMRNSGRCFFKRVHTHTTQIKRGRRTQNHKKRISNKNLIMVISL